MGCGARVRGGRCGARWPWLAGVPKQPPNSTVYPNRRTGAQWPVGLFVHGSSKAHCPQSNSHSLRVKRNESRAVAAHAPPAPWTGSMAVLAKQACGGWGGGVSKLPNLPHKERLFRRKIADVIIIR